MIKGYKNKMQAQPANKAAEATFGEGCLEACHCVVCDPDFGTRGVTHFIDSHHVTPKGIFFIGDNAEKDADGKWHFKDPSVYV